METVEDIRRLPPLEADGIHIWGVHLPEIEERADRLHAILCAEEQEKAARFFRRSDRLSSTVSRGALRVLLAGYTGLGAETIRFDYSENGKPHLADSEVAFNVSHSGEWIVLAIGRSGRLGVDIEAVKHETDVAAIASRYFTPEEITWMADTEDPHALFFRLWARKEAYVKACGSALFREVSAFTVPLEDGEKDGWFFHELKAGSRHAAAVVSDYPSTAPACFDFCGLQW